MENEKGGHGGSYTKFLTMIGTSVVAMYLLTYLNSYDITAHAWFSETRLFMSLIMGSAMAVIMLSYMFGMYRSTKVNLAIYAGSAVLFITALWLVRSQETVSDVDYMEAMIPHHSIAILTSERARIEDARVKKLAGEIIEAQRREIREMEWLIADIREKGVAANEAEAGARAVPEFSGAK
jgi:hypothetical protein